MKKDKVEYSPQVTYHIEPSEHIRMRPQLYFKTLFEEKTLDSLPLEIIQYAIDQKSTVITLNLYADEFSIEFNVGMSLEVYQDYFGDITQAEATLVKIAKSVPLWKKSAQESGLGELIGLIRINAASIWCKLLTYSNGQKGEFLFKEGKTETRTICGSDEKENYTKITVKPDSSIFTDLKINPTTLQEKIDAIREKLNGFDIQLYINTNQKKPN
jgi:DNA gyrase/topoisomerase IV subunit B